MHEERVRRDFHPRRYCRTNIILFKIVTKLLLLKTAVDPPVTERTRPVAPAANYVFLPAIKSISTATSLGRRETSTVARAGGSEGK